MAGSAPHIPEDDIEAAAQQNVQDENARTKSDGRSLSDPAQPIHQLPEDHMEAEAQQPVQAEKPSADDDKCSHGDEVPELTYNQMLYEFINTVPAGTRLANTFLYFDNLSRVNLLYLMNELAKYEQAMQKDKTAPQDMEQLGDLLHRYTTAVQDPGYWSKRLKLGSYFRKPLQNTFPTIYPDYKDAKLVHLDESSKSKSGSIDPLRNFLKRVLPRILTWTLEEREHHDVWDWLDMEPEDISPFVDTLARFIVAITGGLSLVIPMLVMRLGETLTKSLTTVSVAVILFSALTSLMFKASNVETLGATAAYAAVLVVFVGTSG